MKNMIIAVGGTVFIMTVMGLQFQMDRTIRDERQLKYSADEMAATAALCFDAEAFGNGDMIFDKTAAEKNARRIAELNGYDFRWEVRFDEEGERKAIKIQVYGEKHAVLSIYEQVGY